MVSTAHIDYADRWKAAALWAHTLISRPETSYAFAYMGWMRSGAIGIEPERGRITKAQALEIREAVHGFKLWGD